MLGNDNREWQQERGTVRNLSTNGSKTVPVDDDIGERVLGDSGTTGNLGMATEQGAGDDIGEQQQERGPW